MDADDREAGFVSLLTEHQLALKLFVNSLLPGDAGAADVAQAHKFIENLDNGYDYVVGDRGIRLSGGQRQRLALARALATRPNFLLLDEATSSLDMVTEKEILSAMREASQGRTTIIIAHRLSTITDSDKILVLDEGRVVETGTHRELLARHGLYSKLWEAQKREQDESASKLEPVLEAVLAE